MGQFTHRRKSGVKRSHGEPTPTRNHDFPQQPEDSHGRSQRATVTADESRSPKPALYHQSLPPNHKHVHSPQDEYTARYEYPPPPPPARSDPRYFPEPQESHRNDKGRRDAWRAFQSMRNWVNTPPTKVPPRHHRSYEHFQNRPQPGFSGMPRAASARKLTGFAPNTPGDGEPMAQTSAYTHHDPRRESYFPEDDTPHSPTMARPELATSPLKKSQSSTGLNDASHRSQIPELRRLSTRYATRGGEKTYVNGVGRSSSMRNSPVERESIGHEDDNVRRPHFHHDSSARHRSASLNLRGTPSAEALSSSESESSSDAEPEDFASKPNAKLRTQREKIGTSAFTFHHVTSNGTALNDQFPPPNHKHARSPQDENIAQYEYPPPPPRSDHRSFPEPPQYHRNSNLRMDDIGQRAEEHQGTAAETIDKGSTS